MARIGVLICESPAAQAHQHHEQKKSTYKKSLGEEDKGEIKELLTDMREIINKHYPYSNLSRAFYVFSGVMVGHFALGAKTIALTAATSITLPGFLIGGGAVALCLLLYHLYRYRTCCKPSKAGLFKNILDKNSSFCNKADTMLGAIAQQKYKTGK